MGRRTDWQDGGEGHFLGLGQRMLATDTGEYPMLDVRHIVIESPAVEAEATEDGDG